MAMAPSLSSVQQQRNDLATVINKFTAHEIFQSDPPIRVPFSDSTTYFQQLMEVMVPQFLGQFPMSGAWDKELTQFAESLLDLFSRGVRRLHGLFQNQRHYERSWLANIICFTSYMNSWHRMGVKIEGGVSSPNDLCESAISVATGILGILDSEIVLFEDGSNRVPSPWSAFRTVMLEMLSLAKDLLDVTSKSFPFTILPLDNDSNSDAVHDPFRKSSSPKVSITLGSALEAYDLAAAILKITTDTLALPLCCEPFVADIRRTNTELVCVILCTFLDASSSSLVPFTEPDISFSMLRATESLVILLQSSASLSPLPSFLCRLITVRLLVGPRPDFQKTDDLLMKGILALPSTFSLSGPALQFAETLRAEMWEEEGSTLRRLLYTFLLKAIPVLPQPTLQIISDIVEKKHDEGSPELLEVRSLFLRRISAVNGILPPLGNLSLGKRKRADTSTWREDIMQELQKSFSSKSFLQEISPLADDEWLSMVLNHIHSKSERPLEDPTAESRFALSATLVKVVGIITERPGRSPKVPVRGLLKALFLPCARLLDGDAAQIMNATRKNVYWILSQATRNGDHSQVQSSRIFDLAKRGMEHRERPVRISAGKVLVAYTEAYGTYAINAPETIESLFNLVMDLLDVGGQAVRETSIATLGCMGRTANDYILGRVICSLLAQWGQESSLLKSLAYVQLKDLSRRRKKTAYSFLSPYLPEIIRYVAANVCSTPSLLSELGRFLSRDPPELLSFTLTHSLPSLVVTCSKDEIHAIARLVSRPVAALLVDKTADILKTIYLLPDDADTEQGLAFLTQMVAEAAGAKADSVGTQALVNSCIAGLLAELVMVLGDENEKIVKSAKRALAKVEKTTAASSQQRSKPAPRDLATFLKPHILGIMTHLNEVLQEVQGKRSPAYKRQVIRSIGVLVSEVGTPIIAIAPQIMAAMQSVLHVSTFTEVTLLSWQLFITKLTFRDIGPYIGSTSAAFVKGWNSFDEACRKIARETLEYLILENGDEIKASLDNIVSLAGIPELEASHSRLEHLRRGRSDTWRLDNLLERCSSENLTVASLSLLELKQFMSSHEELMRKYASGDVFDPAIRSIVNVLFSAAARDGEAFEDLRIIAYECIGLLGAVDPDRFDPITKGPPVTVIHNFVDEGEGVNFALHLIRDLLVDAFRSTSDLRYQSHLAYAIQELLKFCGFTPDLIKNGSSASIPIKIRGRWSSLPTHMLDTIAPLLEGKFSHDLTHSPKVQHPLYETTSSYREWIQLWASHLITRVSGPQAKTVFGSFRLAVRSQDVEVARYLIPHLVLNVLISGEEDDRTNIRLEILSVLQDQVDVDQGQIDDRRLLSAQTVFLLMDHLSTWIRMVRQHLIKKRSDAKKTRGTSLNSGDDLEDQLMQVDSLITSIDRDLMSTAAFNCRSYARALMTLEQLIASRKEVQVTEADLQPYYERLHLIYSHLDEPDGMEGVSTKVVAPSLEHQIREHESTGRWTSAQSCWELKLQQSPHDVDLHIGLLRCLRNLGHYDTLRTHIRGIITTHPNWEPILAGFHVEGAWMVGDWEAVEEIVSRSNVVTPETTIARLLLALRSQSPENLPASFRAARSVLGAPITAVGKQSYRRSYDSTINLHLVHELEMIHSANLSISTQGPGNQDITKIPSQLKSTLAARLQSTLPTFKAQEPILSMRRTAFGLTPISQKFLKTEIGRAWLASSKIARKAGHWPTAYSAVLQARQWEAPYSYVQSCKLIRASGEALRALQELDNALPWSVSDDIVLDLSGDDLGEDSEDRRMKAKALLLRARWMHEADRFDTNDVVKSFIQPTALVADWESPYFHFGHYHDEILSSFPLQDVRFRGARSRYQICKQYAIALAHGSKYVYQTMPRMLTVWLDAAEDPELVELDMKRQNGTGDLQVIQNAQVRMNQVIELAIKSLPVYQWLTAFPQIVSRVGHPNLSVYGILSKLIATVLHAYPLQGLWLFTSVVHSRKVERESRGKDIINQVKGRVGDNREQISRLVNQWSSMTTELLALCDVEVADRQEMINMPRNFPNLFRQCPSDLILPIQDSMTVTPPATSTLRDTHKPFPVNAPTFTQFQDEVQIMPTLAKPRKITVRGSNGVLYSFLCKPRDDLRKDARLMDFNSMINKLLKTNSESRRRQLHIRTYSVMPLNEECGLIEWVNNTVCIRNILLKSYDAHEIFMYCFLGLKSRAMQDTLEKGRKAGDEAAAKAFTENILPLFPPVFHEWFLATFPEPTAWLTSRLTYGRTSAVISMVGFILGLGDRHGENILVDSNTGDTMHVDFNCLFDKGKTFEVPERVPFRLTQNIVDGFGVMGVEGVFRNACEVTMQILRDNKDSLMSVLEAFVHDPLVEWEDEKKRRERELRTGRPRSSKRANPVQDIRIPQLKELAHKSLHPIKRKLMGLQSAKHEKGDKEITTANQVERLIKEATSPSNLGSMYVGWAAWM